MWQIEKNVPMPLKHLRGVQRNARVKEKRITSKMIADKMEVGDSVLVDSFSRSRQLQNDLQSIGKIGKSYTQKDGSIRIWRIQ